MVYSSNRVEQRADGIGEAGTDVKNLEHRLGGDTVLAGAYPHQSEYSAR